MVKSSQNCVDQGRPRTIPPAGTEKRYYAILDEPNGQDAVSFAAAELAWTSFDSVVKKFTLSPADKFRTHPTQKPIKLYEWLLTNYAKAGDKILDTHGGSFSSAIACNNLGFDFTGIELDKDYYDAAVNRVEAASKQIRMFA